MLARNARSRGGAGFTPAWQPVRLGAGGVVSKINAPLSDGTILCRTDTYGAYLYVTAGTVTYGATTYPAPAWKQLCGASTFGVIADIIFVSGSGAGVVEIVGAPSNTSVFYMLYKGFLWVSINKGTNWFKTTLTTSQDPNDNAQKERGPFIAVDPNNADVVYIGTDINTASKTSNGTASASGGTTTFSSVTGIGTATSFTRIWAFAQGSSSHIITGTYNTGFYESTNSGASWSLISGSPSTMSQIYADKFGQFWFVDTSGTTLYKYASGSVTSITPGGGRTVCFASDPTSAAVGSNRIVVTYYTGQPNISTDNGATWSEASRTLPQTATSSAPQAPWLGVANQSQGFGDLLLSGYSIIFDTLGNLQFGGGLGVWQTDTPIVTNGTVWKANSLGIEQLVTNQVISSLGCAPVVAVWDKGFFTSRNPDVFPSNYWENNLAKQAIMGGWCIDWASSDPTFFTGWEAGAGSTSYSYSSDGANTYTPWASSPAAPGPGGGNVKALTPLKWLVIPGQGNPLYYTVDGGVTWTLSSVPGSPSNWLGGGPGVGQPICSDRVAADTYCAIRANGAVYTFYVSTDAGATFATTTGVIDGFENLSFLRSSPGHAGHFWWSSGYQNGNGLFTHFWKSTDTCANFTAITNVTEVMEFGFGAPPPVGGTYGITIYIYGWYNGVVGFYQSIDGGATWTAMNIPASIFPLDSTDLVTWLEGDANVYGRVYVGFRGSGAAYIDTADAVPWVNFTNVNPNAALTGTVTLTAQHSGLVPVTSVQISVDGVNIGAAQTGQTSYSVSWNTGGVGHGAHTLKVAATGANGTGSFSIPITTS